MFAILSVFFSWENPVWWCIPVSERLLYTHEFSEADNTILCTFLLLPSIWWSRLHFHFTRSFAEPVSGSSEWGGGLSSNQSRRLTTWSCTFCYCLCSSGWECIFTSQDHLLNQFLVLLNEEEVLHPTKKRRFTFDLADPFSGSSEWEGSVYQRSKFIKWSYTFCFCNRCISWDGIFGAQDHLVWTSSWFFWMRRGGLLPTKEEDSQNDLVHSAVGIDAMVESAFLMHQIICWTNFWNSSWGNISWNPRFKGMYVSILCIPCRLYTI